MQHAQKLHLQQDRHFRNLVEKERAVVGLFDAPDAAIGSAGERTLFVTEEFALQKFAGQGGAIDGDPGAGAAR